MVKLQANAHFAHQQFVQMAALEAALKQMQAAGRLEPPPCSSHSRCKGTRAVVNATALGVIAN